MVVSIQPCSAKGRILENTAESFGKWKEKDGNNSEHAQDAISTLFSSFAHGWDHSLEIRSFLRRIVQESSKFQIESEGGLVNFEVSFSF